MSTEPMSNKKTVVDSIGKKLVNCTYHCEGVQKDLSIGIVPRCLIFENQPGKKGSIVVGLNPGKAKPTEQEFYLKNHNTYNALKTYWYSSIRQLQYYSRLRNILKMLDFDGPILWTDLAKCQCTPKNRIVPIQTMRTCIDTYLRKEIDIFPSSYTIFGVGNDAFKFCALSFPEHFVVGIPHPTGSYGNFNKLEKNIKKNKQKYIKKLSTKKNIDKKYYAIKIFE